MKTSRFLTETSYLDVPGGVVFITPFLPSCYYKCYAAQLCQIALFYFKSITYYLYRFCYVIYHRLRRSTPSAYLTGTSRASWWRYRQTASFLPSAVAPTDSGSPVTFLQTNAACSFQIGQICRSVSLRSSGRFPSSVYRTHTAVPKLTPGG